MASALETLRGQAYGTKKCRMLGIYLQRSWLVLFLATLLFIPFYMFTTPILELIRQPTDIARQAGQLSLVHPLQFSFVILLPQQKFLQCQHKNITSIAISATTFVFHVVLSWLCMHKFNNLHLVGIAITLNVSWWITMLAQMVYIVYFCPLTWIGFSIEAFSGIWEFTKLLVASGVVLWSVCCSFISWTCFSEHSDAKYNQINYKEFSCEQLGALVI